MCKAFFMNPKFVTKLVPGALVRPRFAPHNAELLTPTFLFSLLRRKRMGRRAARNGLAEINGRT